MLAANQSLAYDLTLADPIGDDHGPGSYVYPLDPVFVPGSFDITQFRVREVGTKVRFEISVEGPISDPWGSGAGFSLQSIDIYIDKDGVAGSGATSGLERRNVEFSPTSAWEYCVWCAPPFDTFTSHVIDKDGNTYSSGVSVGCDQASRLISIDVPKSTIGTPSATWKYVVLMLSQSGYEAGRVRGVRKEAEQWVLGGGDDGECDPNVIDLVAEPGVNQEALLSNYDPSTGVKAILINRIDEVAPQIVHTPPATSEAHLPLEVAAEITDDVVVSAIVFARAPGEAYQEFPMERTTPSNWKATLPGSVVDVEGLEYYISATDGTHSGTLPAPSSPFAVTVTPDVTPPSAVSLNASPGMFSPNGDGYKDTSSIEVALSEPCYVDLGIYGPAGGPVRDLADSVFAEAALTRVWDGKDQAGSVVPDGLYTIVARLSDLAGREGAPESASVEVSINQPLRRLDVVFLFHANQNLVPYGRAANRACYKGVLQTLRAHPTLKFVIHFSGTLISDLLWFDPETLDILRQGIAEGQFEIAGSTYAQNIMYSTRIADDDYQFNQHQIAIHRSLIEGVLGASPVSFWNPERVWTQNFVKLLADNGYSNVQIEDHILYESGISGSEYAVRTTTFDGREVNVFDDDKTFEGMVNGAIDSGDTASVMSFLRNLYNEDEQDQYAVCYHEDMEATGLWDYEGGENPQVDFSNLSKLLTALERDPRIRVTTYKDFMLSNEPVEDVTPVVDGAAAWMGEDAWFAENSSPEAQTYRELFDAIRDTIDAIHGTFVAYAPDTLVASRLIDHAWFTLCAHQYEFAVHGFGGIAGTTQWDLARDALVPARAARYALAGAPIAPRAEDINGDTIEEIVARTATDLFVMSPYGGKLLYWFDLEDGTEFVGNENFMRSYGEAYTNDNAYVPVARGCEAYSWLCGNSIFPEINQWNFEARRRCFNDSLWVGGAAEPDLVNTVLPCTLEATAVVFRYDLGDITVTKRLLPSEHAISVEYGIRSGSAAPTQVALEVENGLSPDCLGVMLGGGRALRYWDGEDTSSVFLPGMRGVANVLSDKALLFEFLDAPSAVSGEEDVFGLEVNPRWEIMVPAGGSEAVNLRLRVQSYSGVEPRGNDGLRGQLLITPNPSTGRVDVRLAGASQEAFSAEIFDLRGRLVRTIGGGDGAAGFFSWDGLDASGRAVAPGIYLIRIDSAGSRLTGKITILR